MPRTLVHVVRHGEVHNPDGVLYGRLPGYRLSERGLAMAQLVADTLHDGGAQVRLVVASPLLRAQQTAAPMARAFGLEVGVDARLLEAGNILQGRRLSAGGPTALLAPDVLRHLYNPFTPSWGEPFTQQRDRMIAAVASARTAVDAAGGGEAVLVSHQSPIWALRRALQGQPLWHDPRTRECSLASVTTLTFDGATLLTHDYAEPAAALLPEKPGVAGA
ncbi:histidine phosphatase family protein [Serinibacter salmoneus]|uniref:Broad specificity phosphatase PhoE n=1 Tax=Serinibacter salmoneus TaxID=556530 RepID=A0A2A9D1N1_9MICO|nr:histidine phosphatase family protein [Serinibacter salmoneus]PFG20574.1 broad specificity phosphatase PhoE [Serinibacter salmoneus]